MTSPSRRPSPDRPLSKLEWLTLLHVGSLVIGTTWAFGGQADFVRTPIACWASLSVPITIAALRKGNQSTLRWLWPLAAFNGLVLLASFNPSLREINLGGETLLAHTGSIPWLPSSARPWLAREALWLFDALWLSGFNLALVIRQRRALRGLLLVLCANTLALSIFGTVQKLSHAKGLFFDAVPTPQIRFFASFVYHNHWGAFMVLMMAAWIGLTWHYAKRIQGRNLLHSPIFGGWVVLLLLAATVPLSGSRSCTLLALVLLGMASLHLVWSVVEKRRRRGESALLPVAGIGVALALVLAGAWFVGRETILSRLQTTQRQVADMRDAGRVDFRNDLYRDTWRMASEKLWFGWGMKSYPHVFYGFYHRRASLLDRLPIFFNDAHSDWLQSFAEHGLVGTALLALCGLVPLWSVRRRQAWRALAAYLLIGCGLVLLYAWIEFPFGNLAVVLVWWVLFFSAVQLVRLRQIESAPGSPSVSPQP
jgi:O-antigen ligase